MNIFDKKYTTHQKQFDVKEVVKVSEISDKYGNLRYKVVLNNLEYIDEYSNIKICYQLQVINCFSAPENLILVQKPEFNEPLINDYNYALSLYLDYIKKYTTLVIAETRDLQDISVNGDKIGYEITCPKCCATCKWSRKRVIHKDFIYDVSGKLECVNPENCRKYNANMLEPHYHHRHVHDMMHGHCYRHDDYAHDIIYPTVDPFGVCENYFKCVKQQVPVPGQSITNFIDMRIGSQLDDRIEQAVEKEVKEEIAGEVDKALSVAFNDSALSNVIKDHVDNALQSEEVENKIADIVEDNMTIGSITGNKGIKKFTDTNNNGIQDSNEPDVPDNEEIMILGDIGA